MSVRPTQRRMSPRAILRVCAVLTALATVSAGATPAAARSNARLRASTTGPVVSIDGGAIRGAAMAGGGYTFRGLPYAAPPTGVRRWQPPVPPTPWDGIRDATQYAASCPQALGSGTAGPTDEDCLFLNVSTPALHGGRPVLVWIHGGGWTQGAGRDYDATKLAQSGMVVVTINYRLGALGFLAHPALEAADGSSGNYGQMDQQAALRWVQHNIRRFGGDPNNVTIAGQSAGALSVLFHLMSDGSRGLFQRAIVQSGSFALTQQSLAQGEAFGQSFADLVGCSNQTAECLRQVSVTALRDNYPFAAIPGIVDGAVIKESIGTALAAGRFARVPVINGVVHDEQRVFVEFLGLTVTGGFYVGIPDWPVSADTYEHDISVVLGVSASRAASIAAEYPVGDFASPNIAFSTVDHDASWACPALQINRWLAKRVPTFAYEFNDDNAPPRFFPSPGVATHTSELPYLFDLPDAPIQVPFSPDSAALATEMRAAWTSFAASGDPASESDLRWAGFGGANQERVLSLLAPQSAISRDFASRHHCAFWAAGS